MLSTPHPVVADLSTPESPAVVVEDPDGFRLLLLPAGPVEARAWERAYEYGPAMLVLGETTAVSTDDFLANRTRTGTTYDPGPTHPVPAGACYRDLVLDKAAHADADPYEGVRFVHLHTHTEYSPLDGLSTLEESMAVIKADPEGGGAYGSADHGNCAVHPEQQDVCRTHGIHPVFGMEAYLVPDRHRRSISWLELDGVRVEETHLTATEKAKVKKVNDSAEVKSEYTHITLWAQDQTGLRNLWAMSTEAYRDGLYDGKPRLDWDTLERLNEGVLAGTGCLRGPVSRPLAEGDPDTARANLMRLAGIFGDRLYVEIHTNSLPAQIEVNQTLLGYCDGYGLRPLATVDSHYASPEHKIVHQTWLAMSTGRTLSDETTLFQGDQDYHLKTAAEVRASLAYLPSDFVEQAMDNTVALARSCTAEITGEPTPPVYSKASPQHPDPVLRDAERLREICEANWARKVIGKARPEAEYRARFEREMALLIAKGFCGYYLVVNDYVVWSKWRGCLVGPGRGSGGGSLVAYLADIVEVDAVDADLIFERFMTEGRTSLPDFDIDFPTSWRGRILTYVKERWGGEAYVVNIGTVQRLRVKAAVNDSARALGPVLPYEIPFNAFDDLKKAVDEATKAAAGTAIDWEDFKAQYADVVEDLNARYPVVMGMADTVVGRVKTYGKHAAGVVISTSTPLTDLPMRLAHDDNTGTDVLVSQFDMNALEALGYVKFDFLTLRTLDTLQVAVDLIAERRGRTLNLYDLSPEYADPQVWDEVSGGTTMGLFQIETAAGTQLTKRMRPANIYDLAAVMTVVRPGPRRSGLTESFLRRRDGLEAVTYPDHRMEGFVGDTYGAMIYQEQVMAACMTLAGYDSNEADGVRKLLGKKQVEKVAAAGQEFVARAVPHGTDPIVAEELWAQMAEFAKYGFNKAHAFAYAVLGFWCAFLRVHYPQEFLVACLTTVDSDRLSDFISEARRAGYAVAAPDVNRSQDAFSADGVEILYGLGQIKGIGVDTAAQIVHYAPYADLDDFVARCVKFTGSKVNMGHVRTLVAAGAFDALVPNRKVVETALQMEADGAFKVCQHKTEAPNPAHPHRLPCGFDWATEPDPPMLPKGRGKNKTYHPKPPPKACNRACRQFLAPSGPDPLTIGSYTDQEIMAKERDLLGVWVSRTPFDVVPEEVWDDESLHSGSQIEAAPAGTAFVSIGVIEAVREKRDVNGGRYAFVTLNLRDANVEAICFTSVYAERTDQIVVDRLGVLEINKTPRGYQLADFQAIN